MPAIPATARARVRATARQARVFAHRAVGRRVVLWTYSGMRGGNWLYYWQYAFTRSMLGERALVRWLPGMDAWLDEFPFLRPLTIHDEQIRRQDHIDRDIRFGFGRHFTRGENEAFCSELASSPQFRGRLQDAAAAVEGACVVNVRRGDYFTDPAVFRRYGIDTTAHVFDALRILESVGRKPQRLVVVSDDVDWCAQQLLPSLETPADFIPNRTGMFDDLATIAAAETAVLANSTFSYWGAYIASVHKPHSIHVAPHHHEVENGEFDSRMFDPRWLRTGFSPPASA